MTEWRDRELSCQEVRLLDDKRRHTLVSSCIGKVVEHVGANIHRISVYTERRKIGKESHIRVPCRTDQILLKLKERKATCGSDGGEQQGAIDSQAPDD